MAGDTYRVLQLEVAEALFLACAAQVFVKEQGVVDTDASVRLEARIWLHWVVLQRQRWRQLLDVRQLAVQPAAQTFYADGVLERGSCQQLQADVVGEHVGKGQAQLGIAVQGRLGARHLVAVELEVAAALVRGGGDGACAQDHVPRLIGVGGRGGERKGHKRGTQQGLVHGSSQRTLLIE
ncbi:hypothetical protein D3C72_1762680 [compost metagenome]